jgi:hypothetical protein
VVVVSGTGVVVVVATGVGVLLVGGRIEVVLLTIEDVLVRTVTSSIGVGEQAAGRKIPDKITSTIK